LLLLGRAPAPPRARGDFRAAIEAEGATVRVLSADVADREELLAALAGADDLPPVAGVVHAAGVVHSAPIDALDERSLRAVMRPKVAGALVLHELFPPGSVDFFVLFSSAGGLLHLPGQAAYAAGNAFLDGLARHRRAAGDDHAVSLAWTSWRGLGMAAAAASAATVDAELRARAAGDVTADDALRAWGGVHPGLGANVAVLTVLPGAAPAAVLRALAAAPPATAVEWAALPDTQRLELVTAQVRDAAADVLGLPSERVDTHRPLTESGLDSLLAVALRVQLTERLGVAAAPTLLWHHPTVAAIASHLASTVPASTGAEPVPQPEPEPVPQPEPEPERRPAPPPAREPTQQPERAQP
ncbi:beta-ketoacyl reductase, partial [Frankia sp. CiP1_Cm_nod1]